MKTKKFERVENYLIALMEKNNQSMDQLSQLTYKDLMEKFELAGIGERTIEMLLEAGYKKVEDLAQEEDIHKLALSTGLGISNAQAIAESAQEFLGSEKDILAAILAERDAEQALAEQEESDVQPEGDLSNSDSNDDTGSVDNVDESDGHGSETVKPEESSDA